MMDFRFQVISEGPRASFSDISARSCTKAKLSSAFASRSAFCFCLLRCQISPFLCTLRDSGVRVSSFLRCVCEHLHFQPHTAGEYFDGFSLLHLESQLAAQIFWELASQFRMSLETLFDGQVHGEYILRLLMKYFVSFFKTSLVIQLAASRFVKLPRPLLH